MPEELDSLFSFGRCVLHGSESLHPPRQTHRAGHDLERFARMLHAVWHSHLHVDATLRSSRRRKG